MANEFVGIGELKFGDSPDTTLTAPNLGSCLGIAVYDPKKKHGAMIHCLLPNSKTNPEKAASQPTTFVDTGVVMMLSGLIERGSQLKDLIIAVAGGSNINDSENVFEIGKKNYTVLRKVLWKNNLLIKAENVGDSVSRTISLNIETGEIWLKISGGENKKMI